MGSFQSNFGNYNSFNNGFNGHTTTHHLTSSTPTSDRANIQVKEIPIPKTSDMIVMTGEEETEIVDLTPEQGDQYNDEPTGNTAHGGTTSGQGTSGGVDGGEYVMIPPSSEDDDFMTAPYNPSGGGSSSDGMDSTPPSEAGFMGGGHEPAGVDIHDIDFDDANGKQPEVPVPGITLAKYHYDDEDPDIVYFVDDNGYTYKMFLIDGNWVITTVWNTEGEEIDFPSELIQAIMILQEMGIQFEGFDFSEENDFFIIYTDQGNIIYNFELRLGRFESKDGTNQYDNTDIYSLWNMLLNQYGGYQGFFDIYSEQYINDPMVWEIIRKYFPEEDITEEQIQLLFSRMRRIGCGYIATINALFAEFGHLSNEEWQTLFGMGKENENNESNFYYFFLDFFLFYQQELGEGFDSFEALLGNEEDLDDDSSFSDIEGANGMDTDFLIEMVTKYYESKGIKANVTAVDTKGNYQEAIEEALKNGQHVVMAGEDMEMYFPYDIDGNGELDDEYESMADSHGYTITGITEDGKWIVSTWARQLIIDPAEIDSDTYMEIFIIDFQ